MSEQNGDRARFQKNRKRKLRRRQRVQALVVRLGIPTNGSAARDITPASGAPPVEAVTNTGQPVR